MQKSQLRVLSPEKTNSIKLKVSNKLFPEDFFKRSSSQSPKKNLQKTRYRVISPQKKGVTQNLLKNHIYWDIMRQELEKCKNLSQNDKTRPIQRIWVYSQKKHRIKSTKELQIRHQSRQQRRLQPIINNYNIQSPQKTTQKSQLYEEGLFTFYGKSPTKGLNVVLPPII